MSELVKSLNFGHRLTPDGCFDTARTDEIMFAAAKRITELEAEVHYLTNAGTIECMVRNKAVAEYIGNLEARLQSHSANTVGWPTPVMDAAPACEQTAWADQLITKYTAHQIAFAVKYEAEERAPHVAGTVEGIRMQAVMDACDEIMELIEGARVANHQATFQSGHECVSRVSNSDSQMNKQDATRNAGESDR